MIFDEELTYLGSANIIPAEENSALELGDAAPPIGPNPKVSPPAQDVQTTSERDQDPTRLVGPVLR